MTQLSWLVMQIETTDLNQNLHSQPSPPVFPCSQEPFELGLIKWNRAWDKCPIRASVKGMQ